MEDTQSVDTAGDSGAGMVVDIDTSDALEMGPVEAGEYKVQILKAQFKKGEGNAGPWQGINLTLDIPDELSADIFNAMVWLPVEGQAQKRFEKAKTGLDKFKQCFGISASEAFTLDDLQGKEGWAYLTIDSDPEYGDQNKVSKWVTGPGESGGSSVQY